MILKRVRLAAIAALAISSAPAIVAPAHADPAQATWVSQENNQPGDSGWVVTPQQYADDDTFAGYAEHSSVLPGEPIVLRINNELTSSETVRAYRVGYYSGMGGRLVASTDPLPAQVQPRGERTPTNPLGAHLVATDAAGATVNTVDAGDWQPTTSLDTTGWPEGAYILVLDAGNGKESQIPVVVRSTSFTGRTVMVSAPSTWQAYNRWGGYSAYYGLCPQGNLSFQCRSRVVSFNRPLDQNTGVDHFMVMERAAIVEAEKTGVDLAYTTNTDLATDGAPTYAGARALVTLGHDEYWSNSQQAAYTALRDGGTNLVFAGGNTFWWRVRYQPGADGRPAGMEIWKSATEDPVKDPTQATLNFTEPASLGLLGGRYQCYSVNAPLHITDPSFFLFAGTGATAGQDYTGLLREEVDATANTPATPGNLQVASHSTYTCPPAKASRNADMTYYTAPSGAGVVDMASMGWVMAMDPLHYDRHPFPTETITFATQVFDNAILTASQGPLGLSHPAQPNLTTIYPAPKPAPTPISNPNDPGFPITTPPAQPMNHGSKTFGDLTGDRMADLVKVQSDGTQWMVPTIPGPSFGAAKVVGRNWGGMNWISMVPDLNGDGWPEMAARRLDGTLWLYPGLGKGLWGVPTRLGTGWGSMTSLTVTLDISGDGRPDLLARAQDGTLLSYHFGGVTQSMSRGTQVGRGWQSMTSIIAVDDLSGDHRPDVMAIRSDGGLFLYTAVDGRLRSLGQVGHGWGGFRIATSPGDMDGDGRWDLVGIRKDGNLYEYRNLGRSWGPARLLATGWSTTKLLA